jgi:hypothetical protein
LDDKVTEAFRAPTLPDRVRNTIEAAKPSTPETTTIPIVITILVARPVKTVSERDPVLWFIDFILEIMGANPLPQEIVTPTALSEGSFHESLPLIRSKPAELQSS